MMKSNKKCVIAMSGGLDSTCLALEMLSRGYEVKAYGFKYGQKHSIELDKVRVNVSYLSATKRLPIEFQEIDLTNVFNESASSLCGDGGDIPEGHYQDENMKSTVVENRNVIFASIIYSKALSWSKRTNSDVTITLGLHAGDHCFTKETKILTPSGLKTFAELKEGDEVYSFDENNNISEIDRVTKKIVVGESNNIYNISTTTGDIRTTGEHKFYRVKFDNFDSSKGYDKHIEMCRTSELNNGDCLLTSRLLPNKSESIQDIVDLSEFIKNDDKFKYDDESIYIKQTNKYPRYINTENLSKLMAWYITEGRTNIRKKSLSNNYSSFFSQSLWKNFENCESIQNLFKNSNIPVKYEFSKKTENGIPKEITYYLNGVISVLCQTAGCKSSEKCIPEWLMNILINNPKSRKEFIMTMIAGDGHYDNNSGMYSYTSNSNKLIEDLSFLIKLNSNSVKIHKTKRGNIIISFNNFERKSGLIKFGPNSITRITNISKEDTTEEVYDITVEKNHNFYAGSLGNILVHNCVYPDTTPESQKAVAEAFKISNWGSERITYEAPFNDIDKGDVLKTGIKAMKVMNFAETEIDYVLSHTISCYNPNEQGESCGKCGTCTERLEAFEKAGRKDPINYQS